MTVRVDHHGAVAIVTIDRPPRRNALSTAIMQQLEHQLARLDGDSTVRAIVLTGAPPSFCAGSDLKELAVMSTAEMIDHEAMTGRVARGIGGMGTPVIAAVEGHAIGGGFVLAISCDLVVTAVNAAWAMPEVSLGWFPPWGMKALTARTGAPVARRLVWGYETLDGEGALRAGVADRIAPAGAALDTALDIAGRIAALPSEAVKGTKRYFSRVISGDALEWDAEASDAFARDCETPAALSSLARFRHKA